MNVILLEKMGKLGEIGETANVKAGYARNFLFPQGKAIQATKQNMAEFESRRAELMAAHNAKVAEAQTRASKVEGVVLTMQVNASDEGKLFGSVGTKDIADALNAQVGSDLVKAEVMLPNGAIRDLGTFEIDLDLGHDVGAKISVAVVRQDAAGVSDDGSVMTDETEEDAAADGDEDEN